jgi:hypothetical protein
MATTLDDTKRLHCDDPSRPIPRVNAFADARSELAELLHPITPETFMTEYWGRKPLLIKGTPEKLQTLFPGGFGLTDFYNAAREAAERKAPGFMLLARKPQEMFPMGDSGPQPYMFIQPDQMEWLFAAGASIAADGIIDGRATRLAAAVKTQLNHLGPVKIKATLSPQNHGWPPHIDAISGILIQCEGRKRFMVSPEPVFQAPRWHIVFSSDGTPRSFPSNQQPWEEIECVDLQNLAEYILEPGDILFMPPGVVHTTEALTESTLNVGLMFEHRHFLHLLTRVLEQLLMRNPDWRHFPAVNPLNVVPGQLPAEASEFFAARLGELRDVIDSLTSSTPELTREWHRLVADPGDSILAGLSMGQSGEGHAPLQPTDRLQLSRKVPMTYSLTTESDSGARLDLFVANKEISVAGEWLPFLKNILEKQTFTAESAMDWTADGTSFPWTAVCENLEALLDQGILEHCRNAQ